MKSTERFDRLLLAALARESRPATSDTLLDVATGLALAGAWSSAQVAPLTRRVVAARLQLLERAGKVRRAGSDIDGRARRTTPAYVVTEQGADVPVPAPPYADDLPDIRSSRGNVGHDPESMSRDQIATLLDGQDLIIECVGRFLADLSTTREKVRKRLAAAGLGDHG